MNYPQHFDVIVVGGGHAGTEAAAASARLGANTLLLTQNIETIGIMSCNPAIGGIGKGHLVKEIDALDGLMACAADQAGIQFRILNSRKGAAVRATRIQADRQLYRLAIRQLLDRQENLQIFQSMVTGLTFQGEQVTGVTTQHQISFSATCVVLTAGTFLGGKIHVGLNQFSSGRAGDAASNELSQALRDLPFTVERLKTGTPPRLDRKTLNVESLTEQWGDEPRPVFSYLGSREQHPAQIACYITHTNENTHDIIRSYLHESPMYTGVIEGVGPRYCPSIEDKIMRFADKSSHQIFLEPESLSSDEIYPNGVSTSLPFAAQIAYIRSIKGLENAFITRPGYAIEYDFFNPQALHMSLETRAIKQLYFAGQINGTTGYEEAAAQGLLAGINAARRAKSQEDWLPDRSQSYLGVMVDDLVTQGTQEPYRMFTSRAEYRLSLREDNADQRLTELGYQLGVVGDDRYRAYDRKLTALQQMKATLKKVWIQPSEATGAPSVEQLAGQPERSAEGKGLQLAREANAYDLLKRPDVRYDDLPAHPDLNGSLDEALKIQLEIEIKYEGYLKRQQEDIDRQKRHEEKIIPSDFDYQGVKGLSAEVCEKLSQLRPHTIGQALRIPGVTPAAISLVLVYLKRHIASV